MKEDYLQRVYQKNPDVVFRIIAGEAILVPLSKETQTVGRLFTLNEVGSFIWGKIDGKRTLEDISSEIQKEYDVTPKIVMEDLTELIISLKKVGAIRRKE